MEKKEVIVFRKVIPAGTKEEVRERIKADGTIEGLTVAFYMGQQKALQVWAEVENRGSKSREKLITFPQGTDQFLSGDDEKRDYKPVLSVQNDDYIVITANNTGQYDYSLVVDVEIDYFAGKKRVIGGVV